MAIEQAAGPARAPLNTDGFAMNKTFLLMALAVASFLQLTLTGCANPSGIASHAKPVTAAAVGLPDIASPSAVTSGADWWQGFGDTTLSSLVDRALAGNPNLGAAQARLARAQAGADAVRATSGPQVNGTFDATRQRYSEYGLVPPPLAGHTYSSATLQVGASWELDFFGRNRAALDAALGAQRAAQADAQAARVLLASNVARGYVQLARLIEQREVAARALSQRGETLSLIRQRVDAGLDTNVELRQGEGALPETRQQLELLDEQIVLSRHALATLTAQAPNALDSLQPRLAGLQAVPVPASVPADLLGRRADIDAARWRVEAATGDVAAARAQFYPNVNLTAFVGLSSIGLDRLFRSGSEQYGAGPAIRLPIFDSGRLRANLSGRSADLDAAIETYNGTVFDAVRDVADQLASLQSIARQQTEQAAAQASAESAYDLALQRYKAGLGTFLVVLNAETQVLVQRRSATDLKARAIDTQIALVRALGGGYVPEVTHTQAAVTTSRAQP
jgi:NodT family efflux transporter outer membrane factor (OMF) lipoprotein